MKINTCTKIILAFAFCLGINLSINNHAYPRPKHRLLCQISSELCQKKEHNLLCTEDDSCDDEQFLKDAKDIKSRAQEN